jgi:hypothetical protein
MASKHHPTVRHGAFAAATVAMSFEQQRVKQQRIEQQCKEHTKGRSAAWKTGCALA